MAARLIRKPAISFVFALAVVGTVRPILAQTPAERLAMAEAAAKKEGKIAIAGPQGRAWQTALQFFSKDYPDIKTDVTSFQGDEFWPRLQKEREVNQYLWDVRVGGINQTVWRIKGSGAFAKVKDMFLRPEIAEEQNWYGGFEHAFLDSDKAYFPSFCLYQSRTADINADYIKPSEFADLREIINPKWRGKINILDPWGGSASITFTVMYRHYGPDFFKALLVDQKPSYVKDPRQAIGWLASGKYPITIGSSNAALDEYEKAGVKLNLYQPEGIRVWSPGVCALMAFEKSPHPNATLVFVNWLLSRDVQERLMKQLSLNSRMRGVTKYMPADRSVDENKTPDYELGQTEAFSRDMLQSGELVRSLLP